MKTLKGMCVPICTPFVEGGEALDEAAFRQHIDWLLEHRVHAILACGGTGEFAYLRKAERRRIAGRAAVVVQTSAINTADAIEASRAAQAIGADAIMLLPPYFEAPGMSGVLWHYEQIARSVDLPIIVYNIPQHSNVDITPEVFAELLKIDNVRYIKDSTGSMVRIQQLVATGGGVFNGADPIAFQGLLAGAVGTIWGGINVMPAEAMALYDLVVDGRLVEANALWQRMLPAQLFFWTHDYNASVKTAANLMGRPLGECRKPQLPPTEGELSALREALASLSAPVRSVA
jgi:4-hydroxy-tetrahydrodipicolinate synthase